MVRLLDIKENGQNYFMDAARLAWTLLLDRDDDTNISHRHMPLYSDHFRFMASDPYRVWMVIENDDGEKVGMTYLTRRNEVGIHILKAHQGKGYAKNALLQLLAIHRPLPAEPSVRPGHFVANINPRNTASIALFEGIGGKHISNTYRL